MRGETFTPVPNRGIITLSIMLANIMQGVDNTILNVALPHVQGSLSASQWVDLSRPMLSGERPVSVAARPGECLLTERTAGFQAPRREPSLCLRRTSRGWATSPCS
jgi:hypothetical protein